MHKFTYSLAVVYETLRLYPMVSDDSIELYFAYICVKAPITPKRAQTDTTLNAGLPPNQRQLQVPASTYTYILSPGLHYNPSYWDDPQEFTPSRFMDSNWNRDAFIPFSVGPRACIGRR
jgi:hypothetical protein